MSDTVTFTFTGLPLQLDSWDNAISSFVGTRQLVHEARGRTHRGIDIRAPQGTPVYSVGWAIIEDVGEDSSRGKYIILRHEKNDQGLEFTDGPYYTLYYHLSEIKPTLSKGTVILRAGAELGKVGSTGNSTGPHLHLELKKGNQSLDPFPYLADLITKQQINILAQRDTTGTERVGSTLISPYIASLDSFHPKIQYELTRRRLSRETANTYMPFVRLTSLTQVLTGNLTEGSPDKKDELSDVYCPSLGVHDRKLVKFEDIYRPQGDNKRSIVAYASRIQNQTKERIPVVVKNAENDPDNVPIPGIASIVAERSTAGPMGVRGGLFKAELKIIAYSQGQVDTLLRYYLRPATRVVLEFGRTSSNNSEPPITVFDWLQSKDDIKRTIKELITDVDTQREFIDQYVYNSYGNYEIFIGYVVKFNLKYTKDNLYEISLTVHSVQQFEVPIKQSGAKADCATSISNPCLAMDIDEYFNPSYNYKLNTFQNLLTIASTGTGNNPVYAKWNNHVISVREPQRVPAGSVTDGNTQTGTTSDTARIRAPFLISWRFFIEMVLNSKALGLLSVIVPQRSDSETLKLLQNSVIKPVTPVNQNNTRVDRLIANEVGYHPKLRSTNPGVMIIYNPQAANEAKDVLAIAGTIDNELRAALQDNPENYARTLLNKISQNGDVPGFSNLNGSSRNAGAGSLTNGIWLNSDAIINAFTSTDTITSAINKLLIDMNAATEGYWNLQLLSNDTKNPGLHVVDMALSKTLNIETDTEKLPVPAPEDTNFINATVGAISTTPTTGSFGNKLYMFNRKYKKLTDDIIGSELLDLNVEFNLPQVVAVQAIAGVGGVAQQSTLQSINIDELKKISLLPELYVTCTESEQENGECSNTQINNLEDQISRLRAEKEALEAENKFVLEGDTQETRENLTIGQRIRRFGVSVFESIGRAQTQQGAGAVLTINNIRLNSINKELQENEAAVQQIRLGNNNASAIFTDYGDFGSLLRFIEYNPARMVKELTADINVINNRPVAHSFNSSNLTKTIVDLTMPGIGGIELFQSFLVDRVPSILTKGYYVVTKINHEFSTQNGWITKIQGRFRYQPGVGER